MHTHISFDDSKSESKYTYTSQVPMVSNNPNNPPWSTIGQQHRHTSFSSVSGYQQDGTDPRPPSQLPLNAIQPPPTFPPPPQQQTNNNPRYSSTNTPQPLYSHDPKKLIENPHKDTKNEHKDRKTRLTFTRQKAPSRSKSRSRQDSLVSSGGSGGDDEDSVHGGENVDRIDAEQYQGAEMTKGDIQDPYFNPYSPKADGAYADDEEEDTENESVMGRR